MATLTIIKKLVSTALILIAVLISFIVLRPRTGYIDYVLALMFDKHQTVFAPFYQEPNFHRIKKGMTVNEVVDLVGYPMGEAWWFGTSTDIQDIWLCIDSTNHVISGVHFWNKDSWDKESMCRISSRIRPGMQISEVQDISVDIFMANCGINPCSFYIRSPTVTLWAYSMTTNSSSYHQRLVYIAEGKVFETHASFYVD